MLIGGAAGRFRETIRGERKRVESSPVAPNGADAKLSTLPVFWGCRYDRHP